MEIEKLYAKAKEQLLERLPFVVYRKPHTSAVQGIFQKDNKLHTTFQFDISGFVFSSFDHKQPTILFPINESELCTSVYVKPIDYDEDFKKFKSYTDSKLKLRHKQLINLGINKIRDGSLKKIVVSRNEIIPDIKENPVELFKKLLNRYTDTFVYLWYHPDIGIWLGATPETLLQIKEKALFTMSLAGTQSYEGNMDVQWGAKEIEEQKLVTDFIVKALEGKVAEISMSDVQTHKAGTLLHLRTDITALVDSKQSDLTPIIKALHPTPAVCGLPRDTARSFILDHEDYDRGYYTGFLGELNMDVTDSKYSHLFVNLRCMELKENGATIYVGGGITKDSDPEKEWEETVKKTITMKKVLF